MSHHTEATSAQSENDSPVAMDESTRFSFERTILSHERTLMAWVRTATSLITFGFSLYKFFQLEQGALPRPQIHHIISAREFAMLMSAIGSFALVLATIQHWQYRKNLRKQQKELPFSLSLLVAGLITGLGFLATVAAIFRW